MQDFYNPSTGALTGENQIAADGSQTDYVLNADGSQTATALNASGQKTEQVQFNTDGTQVQDFYNPSTGALTGENQIAADGSQTDYVLNADGSQTATALNASGQKTEQAQFSTDGSQIQDFYNPSTGALTGENQIAADGSQIDYTINADGSKDAVVYNAAGQVTGAAQFQPDGSATLVNYDPSTGAAVSETDRAADGSEVDYDLNADGTETAIWYDADGNETQYAEVDGDETDVSTFSPGSAWATQTQIYENGALSEVDNWDGATGALQQVWLYNGGAYPYEVDVAGDGPYFSQVEQIDPDTGDILGTANYDSGTGAWISGSGDDGGYDDGGYDDSGYDDDGYDDGDDGIGDDGGYDDDISNFAFSFAGSQQGAGATSGGNAKSAASAAVAVPNARAPAATASVTAASSSSLATLDHLIHAMAAYGATAGAATLTSGNRTISPIYPLAVSAHV